MKIVIEIDDMLTHCIENCIIETKLLLEEAFKLHGLTKPLSFKRLNDYINLSMIIEESLPDWFNGLNTVCFLQEDSKKNYAVSETVIEHVRKKVKEWYDKNSKSMFNEWKKAILK